MSRRPLSLALFLLLLAVPSQSFAFTTRVHIALANEVRDALIASGDGTIQLRWSEYAVQIPIEDADAIINRPEAFRAGAIGPDITVFPAMTDGTHALDQNPFRQCEMLYLAAFTESERAYALGCFLHGSTDAVAHHFVNYFTGETFTLNPITAARESSYDNAIGHIVTESTIQVSFYDANPGAFSAEALEHDVPQDFVLRSYYDVESPIWQRMTVGSMQKWEAVQARFPMSMDTWPPSTNLQTWISEAGFHPWEHVAMAPVYIDEIQSGRVRLRGQMEARIADLAASSEIAAQPGDDGVIGTPDDETACTVGCAQIYAEYWILVHLLAPRSDTAGNPLPSAFDKISNDLGSDLYGFLPALMQVIVNISAMLNGEINDLGDHGFDLDRDQLVAVFEPIDEWAAVTFAVDWESAGRAVSPSWYTDLSDFLSMFGVSITIPDILAMIFQPIVDEIRAALIEEVRNRAEVFVDGLKTEYDAALQPWRDWVNGTLAESSPGGLGGHSLEYLQASGVMAHAFNLTAATLANHEVVLVADEEVANGPASFDASYTPEWTQLGQCTYLRDAVFPHGLGLVPLLSVQLDDGTYYESTTLDNSPVECHDGALDSFGAPGSTSCAHTTLDALLVDPFGSVSRAYPPAFASGEPGCMNLIVPGLPEPPDPPDPTEDAGMPGTDGGMPDEVDAGMMVVEDGGCGCRAAGAPRNDALAWLAMVAIGAFILRRRGAR
jgi:hypothetical protein